MGFDIRRPDETWDYASDVDPDCIVSGDIQGHDVQVFASDSLRNRITINIG